MPDTIFGLPVLESKTLPVPIDAIMVGDWTVIHRLIDDQILWEIVYSPCPACGWTIYVQRRAHYMRDDVECRVCRTVMPMSILDRVEEDRILYGTPHA